MEPSNILLTATQTSINFGGDAQLVKDINPDNSNNGYAPYTLTEVSGKLFFTANDGVNGRELWVSDGTADGTQLVKDINPDNSNDGLTPFNNLIDVGGKLFFTTDDGITGRELWVSDGTADGTQLVKDINPDNSDYYGDAPNLLTEVGGKLFFTANDSVKGRELWVSDGTADGTQLVKDINPNNIDYGYVPYELTEVGGKLFFTANDSTNGRELWVSDGTADGTQLVKDISPVSDNYYFVPFNLTEVDGKLFFSANDGITDRELWVSDGTADGTRLVKDINPDNNGSDSDEDPPYSLTEVGGKLFFTTDDGITGRELWVSDGTADGTRLVKDINPANSSDSEGPFGPTPYSLTEVDGKLFFTADDGRTGDALWVSDGTADGTRLVKDINPGIDRSNIFNLTVAGDLLFFTVDDGFNGNELWVSNGTTEGTQLFQDINPGIAGSDPSDLTVVGDQLFFTADDGINGRELWAVSIPENSAIVGDKNNNVLNGTSDVDLINGLGGNDVIRGRGNNDILNGGSDNDVLFGNRGSDTIGGGAGNDRIFGDQGNDDLQGGAGDDRISGGIGNDTLQGGAGNDTVRGGAGDDTVIVNNFSGIDMFDGGAGNDVIQFDPVDGRNLTIFLDQGTVGDRNIGGQSFTSFEQIKTGRGNDRLFGNAQANQLDGGSGNDELRGEAGRDRLIGGVGRDTLLGGGGADILTGGLGNDVLIGNGGADTFRFEADLLNGVADTDAIERFQSQDSLDFSAYLEAGGSIETTRVSARLLRIELSGEDIVNVFGNSSALDAAQSQL